MPSSIIIIIRLLLLLLLLWLFLPWYWLGFSNSVAVVRLLARQQPATDIPSLIHIFLAQCSRFAEYDRIMANRTAICYYLWGSNNRIMDIWWRQGDGIDWIL